MDISYQLENLLGCRISPTVLYEYPTIEELAEYLELIQTEDIIAKVDQLSDQEVDLLINKLLH
jgi:hypothetical protein